MMGRQDPSLPAAPLITLSDVTLRVRDRHLLAGTSWEIRTGEHWAVLGPNGSGKSTLVKALVGEVPVVRGRMIRHRPGFGRDRIGYVSFELHEQVISREELRDEARHFSGDLDGEQSVGDFLQPKDRSEAPPRHAFEKAVTAMNIGHLLQRGVRRLSTGEMRRVLIAQALLKSPWLLILDEPFGGLDAASRQDLHDTIGRLIGDGTQVILVTHRFEEIFDACTHVICVKEGRVIAQGRREALLTVEHMGTLYGREPSRPPIRVGRDSPVTTADSNPPRFPILVEMKDVSVAYGKKIVLGGVDWKMRAGENWAIEGPNGSGKSTLLRLITGDHPQAYANDIRLFGRARGSGDTVWEIKRHLAVVSSEFHIRYRKRLRVKDVVLSGFFDSVGLYRQPSPEQSQAAGQWIDRLGISHLAEKMIDQISYGERRMALIARAMVKSPVILILDEPCQGLDPANQELVLDLVNRIGTQTPTRLIYVTHHPGEVPACITHVLRLGGAEGL